MASEHFSRMTGAVAVRRLGLVGLPQLLAEPSISKTAGRIWLGANRASMYRDGTRPSILGAITSVHIDWPRMLSTGALLSDR